MNITYLRYTLRDLYTQFTESLFDMCVLDKEHSMWELLNGFNSPDALRKLFKDGYTAMLISDLEELEYLANNNMRFVLTVTCKDQVFVSLGDDEINW